MASLDGNTLSVLVWHYHDDDVSGPDAAVVLELKGLPTTGGAAKLEHFRIDEEHSNAFSAWKRMGEPQQPMPEQYARLEQAGQLAMLNEAQPVSLAGGQAALKFSLPRQGVSLLQLSW